MQRLIYKTGVYCVDLNIHIIRLVFINHEMFDIVQFQLCIDLSGIRRRHYVKRIYKMVVFMLKKANENIEFQHEN